MAEPTPLAITDAEDADDIAQRELAQLLNEGERAAGFKKWDYDQFRAEVHRHHDR